RMMGVGESLESEQGPAARPAPRGNLASALSCLSFPRSRSRKRSMWRSSCATLFALASLACASAERSDSRAEPARADEAARQWEGPAAQAWGGAGAERPASSAAPDPELDLLRRLFDQARKAKEEKDHAGARARIASAIEKALAEIGEREDASAIVLLTDMGSF